MIEEIKKMLKPKTVKVLKELLSQCPDDALVSFIVPSNSKNELNENAWVASYRDGSKVNGFCIEGKVKAIEIPLKWDNYLNPFTSEIRN